MRKRKFPIFCFVIVVLLLAAIGVAVFVVTHPFAQHISSTTPQPMPTKESQVIHQPLPITDVVNIQTDMNAPDVKTQSLAWAPELRDGYIASVKNPLTPGSKLVINAKSFWYFRNYGEAQATVGTTRYTLHLVRISNHWLLAWTS